MKKYRYTIAVLDQDTVDRYYRRVGYVALIPGTRSQIILIGPWGEEGEGIPWLPAR